MSLTVSSADGYPLIMFMGTTVTPSFIIANNPRHKGQSLKVMGFIAKHMEALDKLYMVTVPLKSVHDILQNNLNTFLKDLEMYRYLRPPNVFTETWLIKDKEENVLVDNQEISDLNWFSNYTNCMTNPMVLVFLSELKEFFAQ